MFPLLSSTGIDYSPPTEPILQAAALSNWRAVHERLTAHTAAGLTPASLANFATYYHCVHQAFGLFADGVLAQDLALRLAAQCWPQLGSQWMDGRQVDQACVLAWLSAHRTVTGLVQVSSPAQLVALDDALYQEAQHLLTQPRLSSQSTLVRVAHYLVLRLPAPTASRYLHALLDRWPEDQAPGAGTPRLLGLADGLAAELLVLTRAHKAGVRHPRIQVRLQQGVRYLLAVKRDVDFLEHQYSVFPYWVHESRQESMFSAELSWRRGDAGQVWLLYEAHAVLHDAELLNMAELVGLNTLLRTSVQATEVVSAGFYRGAAGLAHLYAQLYRASNQRAYSMAYHFWLGRTQALLQPELAAHLPISIEDEPMGGLVGVGLVLLAASQGIKTS